MENSEKEVLKKMPKPPVHRIIREGSTTFCKKCGSTAILRFFFFGRVIGCIQPKCKNYYRRFEK